SLLAFASPNIQYVPTFKAMSRKILTGAETSGRIARTITISVDLSFFSNSVQHSG
ncbi:hypothetical protein L9F63_009247, partial [Diploptera punctata]